MILLTADIHLTDNVRDEYRWGLLPWIHEQVKANPNIKEVVLGGDICDSKDRHSSYLVNRLVDQLTSLSKDCEVYILKGNHDYIDENCPYLQFLTGFNRIYFVSHPCTYQISVGNCLFLPCSKNWQEEWKDINFNEFNLIFTHATYTGAKSETGIELQGIPPSVFKDYKGYVWSGDIHVPQKVAKNVEYAGSPFRVRFGDTFTPRVVLIDDKLKSSSLSFPCISKHTLVCTNLSDLEGQAKKQNVKPNDQVKVRARLKRSEYPIWDELKSQIKEYAIKHEWELYGPELLPVTEKVTKLAAATTYKSNEQILTDYVKAKKLSKQQASVGLSLIQQI